MNVKQPIVLYDGFCSVCSFFVRIILKYEREPNIYFASLHSLYSKTILSEFNLDIKNLNTVVFIVDDNIYIKSSALFKIATYLKFPLSGFRYLKIIPLVVSDFLYDVVAKYRFKVLGKRSSCFVPDEFNRSRFIQ